MPPVVVFDFDLTLTAEHIFPALYQNKRPEQWKGIAKDALLRNRAFALWLFGGAERAALLHRFLRKLRQNNVVLAISSLGFVEDVKVLLYALPDNYLRDANGTSFFSILHGLNEEHAADVWYSDCKTGWVPGVPWNWDRLSKVDFIRKLREKYGTCIVFVDDRGTDHDYDAVERMSITTIPMPSRGGLTETEMTLIFEALSKFGAVTCDRCLCKAAHYLCSGCNERIYCSPQCRTLDWTDTHLLECK